MTGLGGRAPAHPAGDTRRPCDGCGYMMRGGNLCGDCADYGPPRGWRWQYDPVTDRHAKVSRVSAQSAERTTKSQAGAGG